MPGFARADRRRLRTSGSSEPVQGVRCGRGRGTRRATPGEGGAVADDVARLDSVGVAEQACGVARHLIQPDRWGLNSHPVVVNPVQAHRVALWLVGPGLTVKPHVGGQRRTGEPDELVPVDLTGADQVEPSRVEVTLIEGGAVGVPEDPAVRIDQDPADMHSSPCAHHSRAVQPAVGLRLVDLAGVRHALASGR